MMVSMSQLENMIEGGAEDRPELKKFVDRLRTDTSKGGVEMVDIPSLSEEALFEINQCLDSEDVPEPKFLWKPSPEVS